MKRIIVPIAIIVVLIVFFAIVGRREFNRHDGVQTVQSEGAMTIENPSESVPEIPPSSTESEACGTRQAETMPVTEIMPVIETRPTETRQADEKTSLPEQLHASEATQEKPLPAAVPVATPEEAEKLNAFALFLASATITVVEVAMVKYSGCYF